MRIAFNICNIFPPTHKYIFHTRSLFPLPECHLDQSSVRRFHFTLVDDSSHSLEYRSSDRRRSSASRLEAEGSERGQSKTLLRGGDRGREEASFVLFQGGL